MCGLCGVVAPGLFNIDMQRFKQLLIMSQLRGQDSTGVFRVDKPELRKVSKHREKLVVPYYYNKALYDSSYWLSTDTESKAREKLLTPKDAQAYVAHTRSATVGKISQENAHPFDYENVIGAVNGTIREHSQLPYLKDHECDSEALIRNISEFGLKETVEKIGRWGGDFAVIYFDKRDTSLNFFRTEGRPLCFANYSGSLFFASEPNFLRTVFERTGATAEQATSLIWAPKPNQHIRIDLNRPDNNYMFSKEHMVTTEVPFKVETFPRHEETYHQRRARLGFFDDEYFDEWDRQFAAGNNCSLPDVGRKTSLPAVVEQKAEEKATSEASEVASPFSGSKDSSKTDLFDKTSPTPFFGINGRRITRAHFAKVLMDGCAICGSQPDINETDVQYKIAWTEPDQIICQSCQQNSEWVNMWASAHVNKKDRSHVG